jgi:hypothetical protein
MREERPTREGERKTKREARSFATCEPPERKHERGGDDLTSPHVREGGSSDEKSGAQIFRYGTCEHAAVSSGMGDVVR